MLDFSKTLAQLAYLRWSQHIRSRVLDTHWPRTKLDEHGLAVNRFADRQFSLGDTQYLIAEVTPFSFNWRWDVFGNLLAFLMKAFQAWSAASFIRACQEIEADPDHLNHE